MIAPLTTGSLLRAEVSLREPGRLYSRKAASPCVGHGSRPRGLGAGISAIIPWMNTLLIVYHSMTGGTLQMAQAAAGGARSEPALRVSMLRAEDAQATDVLDAGGFIFATPENLAAISGKMKDFFDRTY